MEDGMEEKEKFCMDPSLTLQLPLTCPPSPCSVLSAQTAARSKQAQQNSVWTHFSGCADTSETGCLF